MEPITLTRRDLLALAASTTAVAGVLGGGTALAAPASSKALPAGELDRFVRAYMAAMNSPALTLGLASAEGPIRASTYGYTDLGTKQPATPQHLFEIGSISKSFVGVMVLQLHQEGKVDLHKSILHYLPWLAMENDYGEVTVHHLLTHSSGMPGDAPVFPLAAGQRPKQGFKPGAHFHYSNWGYDVLGRLIETLDQRSWNAALSQRILAPLGMTSTTTIIDSAMRTRLAQSYVPLHGDRPYPRHGALAVAGPLTVTTAAGCIASTPEDMARYMQMFLNRGAGPNSRILSEESFKLFSTPHIPADEFGPGASYGYGLAVDKLDGRTRLRHTGGMVSFMSALQIDLDAGFGAFASVNAQLGYRPNPVVEYALRLLHARKEGKALPPAPPADDSLSVAQPQDYAGVYTAADGRKVEVRAAADRLVMNVNGKDSPLQQAGGGAFIADHASFALYPLVFSRAQQGEGQAAENPATSPVTELIYGPDAYTRSGHTAPAPVAATPELEVYAGQYYTENPWGGGTRVVLRRGRLWLEGVSPLTPVGDGLFRVGEDWSPEVIEFSNPVAGGMQLLTFSGMQMKRIPE